MNELESFHVSLLRNPENFIDFYVTRLQKTVESTMKNTVLYYLIT